ncbi:MAG: hypothetical protein PHX51_08345, partial [Clostridia bacterium]|nr:hypothetical protein [Clostridia bacterium]
MDKGYRDVINDIADAIITESDIHDAIIASGVSIKKNFVEPAEEQFDVEMLGEEDENEDGFNASILSRIKANAVPKKKTESVLKKIKAKEKPVSKPKTKTRMDFLEVNVKELDFL